MSDKNLSDKFKKLFNIEPSFIIKVPGRVNLIGEHTDYNGFPVLPISISCFISAIGAPRTDRSIHIRNIDSRFPYTVFDLSQSIPHSPDGDWANYVKAAVQSLSSVLENTPSGMNVLFQGTIPQSAGLSSSSALVIASALALLAANRHQMNPLELAELMAVGEHYVGTQGGGMDQAICLLGKKCKAVKIDFFPTRRKKPN